MKFYDKNGVLHDNRKDAVISNIKSFFSREKKYADVKKIVNNVIPFPTKAEKKEDHLKPAVVEEPPMTAEEKMYADNPLFPGYETYKIAGLDHINKGTNGKMYYYICPECHRQFEYSRALNEFEVGALDSTLRKCPDCNHWFRLKMLHIDDEAPTTDLCWY